MTRLSVITAASLLVVCAGICAAQQGDDAKKVAVPAQVPCAVMNDKSVSVKDAVAKGMYADYEYTRYVFCCDGCPQAFAKDPAKYASNKGVLLTSFPLPTTIACAVQADHPVNLKAATAAGHFADYNGHRYYFCCGNCPGAFKAHPAQFSKAASVPIGQLPLPKTVNCSVMTDHKVNVADALKSGHFADYNGKRYLFCCNGCPTAFKADPAKYASNDSIPSPKVETPAQ